jgi:uncharacterized protein YndB with AHSA1/START domain
MNRLNSKSYIGQTSRYPLSKRWCRRLTNSPNPHLRAAVNKYGPQAFTRTVLAHASCHQEADLLEKFFILIYQSTDRRFGYNLQSGGLSGVGRHSQDTVQRIRESNRRHWEKKSPDAMLLHAENARLRWDMWPEEKKRQWAETCQARWWNRSEEDRCRIIELVRQNTRGRKRSVPGWNRGLAGWNAGQKKSLETRKKLSLALKQYWAEKRGEKGADSIKEKADDTRRATVALREVEQAERQLREIKERLDALKFELRGGCAW